MFKISMIKTKFFLKVFELYIACAFIEINFLIYYVKTSVKSILFRIAIC